MASSDSLAASIQGKLDAVHPLNSEYCCIYRVPERLRKINEEAYTPQFVSIGPFHHGKENLKGQETLKLQYLHSFVGRNPGVTMSQYVETIKRIEEKTRECYAEIISVDSDKFVTMMLVDGCFILEFFYEVVEIFYKVVGPVSGTNPWFLDAIERDLILLENQLPFIVLEGLYKLNRGNGDATLTPIIRSYFYIFAQDMLSKKQEQVFKKYHNSSPVKELLTFLGEGCSSSHGSPRGNINEEADPAVPTSSTQTTSVTVDMPELNWDLLRPGSPDVECVPDSMNGA